MRWIHMPDVYVYNPVNRRVEYYNRDLWEPMPYVAGNTLTVGEFRAASYSNMIWTDRRTMEAWNVYRTAWGRSIYVGFAFKRIWQGGHSRQSQHYAGMAFDMGQNLDPATRNALRATAYNVGVWSYVEPAYLTPTWVHVDRRLGPPACAAGYPLLRNGSRGVYVFVLQDALNALGYTGSGLDGYFGSGTAQSVRDFQSAQSLAADGIVGCQTWQSLTSAANGIGQTGTVVNP
jgi:hypothetical protein